MLIEIGDVWWTGSATFGEYERHAEPDALIGVGCQPSICGYLLVAFSKPFFAILPGLCQVAKLSFRICYFSQPRNSDFQPEHMSRLIAKEQVGKSVSGNQRHAPRTQPAPLREEPFNIEVLDSKPLLHRLTSASQVCTKGFRSCSERLFLWILPPRQKARLLLASNRDGFSRDAAFRAYSRFRESEEAVGG